MWRTSTASTSRTSVQTSRRWARAPRSSTSWSRPKELDTTAAGRRRVFVTGIGLVSPHGGDADRVFEQLYAGESAIRKVRSGSEESSVDVLLAPAEFDPSGVIPKGQLFVMDRV